MVEEKYKILQSYFGYDEFRNGQEDLIDSILNRIDTLGIMPTGAGKSMCFQLPALIFEGITLVVSPLISLMKDQVSSLNQIGVHAAFLNSSLTANQYQLALRYAKEGRYKIIYIAPERLMSDEFLDFALQTDISMVSIDEAHCVSQWGQDFRPSYLKIMEFIDKLPKRPVISAFTATATKEVKEDIIKILRLNTPHVLTTGFDRANLSFSVESPKDKYSVVYEYITQNTTQSGIIYCSTRKNVEEVCERLNSDNISATKYHAGLNELDRMNNQDDFIYDRKQVMVATNAFGMGIDKSNVSFVIHYNMPKNIESYYQEAGRAGRDGEPAKCILLYGGQDVITNQFFIENGSDKQELSSEDSWLIKEKDRERLKKMTFYCFTNECLREYILRYFGEYASNYCNNCSNCLTQFEEIEVTSIAKNIINCINSCGQRYGVGVIAETLYGSKTAKLRNNGMINNPYYAVESKESIIKIRQVVNHLILNEYLHQTNDEYSIIKLTNKSKDLLEDDVGMMMKFAQKREIPKKEKIGKANKKKSNLSHLSEVNEELFEALRGLRFNIARENKVPPYIVFSDKTLIDMCHIMPTTDEEMLSVSGVGQFKLEKYGGQFMEVIKNSI